MNVLLLKDGKVHRVEGVPLGGEGELRHRQKATHGRQMRCQNRTTGQTILLWNFLSERSLSFIHRGTFSRRIKEPIEEYRNFREERSDVNNISRTATPTTMETSLEVTIRMRRFFKEDSVESKYLSSRYGSYERPMD